MVNSRDGIGRLRRGTIEQALDFLPEAAMPISSIAEARAHSQCGPTIQTACERGPIGLLVSGSVVLPAHFLSQSNGTVVRERAYRTGS